MPDSVLEVSCRVCPGVIDRVPAADIAQAVAEHCAQLHPGLVPVAGEHYVVLAATPVCDACMSLVELPWWEHVSTPPTPVAGEQDRDQRWILCATCHALWASGDLIRWVRHAWAVAIDRAPWLAQGSPDAQADSRAHLARTFRTLLQRLDAGHVVTLVEDDGPGA
jgi:hypothetical protein